MDEQIEAQYEEFYGGQPAPLPEGVVPDHRQRVAEAFAYMVETSRGLMKRIARQ